MHPVQSISFNGYLLRPIHCFGLIAYCDRCPAFRLVGLKSDGQSFTFSLISFPISDSITSTDLPSVSEAGLASASLLCVYLPQFGITNTLPRAGAREQGRAAIGRRMAALPNSHVCRKSPCQPGVLLGTATPPSDPQMEGFDVAAWQLGGLVLHQTAGAAGWRSKAAVVHQGGGAASGGIGAAAAAEVVVGLLAGGSRAGLE